MEKSETLLSLSLPATWLTLKHVTGECLRLRPGSVKKAAGYLLVANANANALFQADKRTTSQLRQLFFAQKRSKDIFFFNFCDSVFDWATLEPLSYKGAENQDVKKTKTKQDVKAGRLITLSTLCWKMKTIHKRQMKRRSHVPTTTTGNVGTCGGW